MKTPAHWRHKNITALALLPAGWLYAAATALRLKLKKQRVSRSQKPLIFQTITIMRKKNCAN